MLGFLEFAFNQVTQVLKVKVLGLLLLISWAALAAEQIQVL